jgi:ABC-type transport system substrate-binding protein
MYQEDLAKIGITLNILTLDTAAVSNAILSRNYNGMYFTTQSQMQLHPGTVLNGAATRPMNNNEGFTSDDYTQLIKTLNSETDTDKLQQAYAQVNDLLLDESFAQYLSPSQTTRVATAQFHGMTPNLWGGWLYTTAWLAG